MPIYEYKCPECQNGFEILCRSLTKSDRFEICPECGCEKATRVVSRIGSVRAVHEGNPSSCGTTDSGFS